MTLERLAELEAGLSAHDRHAMLGIALADSQRALLAARDQLARLPFAHLDALVCRSITNVGLVRRAVLDGFDNQHLAGAITTGQRDALAGLYAVAIEIERDRRR